MSKYCVALAVTETDEDSLITRVGDEYSIIAHFETGALAERHIEGLLAFLKVTPPPPEPEMAEYAELEVCRDMGCLSIRLAATQQLICDFQLELVRGDENKAKLIDWAEFIARACNAHDDLLAALHSLLKATMHDPVTARRLVGEATLPALAAIGKATTPPQTS